MRKKFPGDGKRTDGRIRRGVAIGQKRKKGAGTDM